MTNLLPRFPSPYHCTSVVGQVVVVVFFAMALCLAMLNLPSGKQVRVSLSRVPHRGT